MFSTTFNSSVPLIVDGQAKIITRPDSLRSELCAAGITLLGWGVARVTSTNGSVILRAVKIIIRASGRRCRHLARYLIGTAPDGVYWEIFLGVVADLRNTLFQLGIRLEVGLLKIVSGLLTRQLGIQQKFSAVCQ